MEQHVVINIHMIAEKTSFETKQVLNKVGNMLKISRVLVYKYGGCEKARNIYFSVFLSNNQ